MNKYIPTIGLLLIAISAFSQPFELNIHKNKLAHFLSLENDVGSERFENNVNYISPKGVAQPILFKRNQDNLPDLIISYFYFQKDSGIANILYEWDDKSVSGLNPKKSTKEINSFIDKYKELYNQIFKTFGAGKSESDVNDLSKIETGDFKKMDTWEPNDSTEIDLYMILSGKYEKKGNTTINPTYRIRLDIRNRRKNAEAFSKPDESKIKELDLVVKTFLSNLQSKDFDKARLSLSDQIINNVPNEQLEKLKQSIKFNDELIIYMHGAQMRLDGSTFLTLQYKYKTDSNTPPKELLNITFDEKNKIIGIRPTKRL